MAVWALLSISQTVKATNTYYVRGAFGDGAWPAVKSGLAMTPKGTVTPTEKYCSFYLIGNLHNDSEWADGTKANPFNTIDGKTYTYTFTGVGKTVYFCVQGYDPDGKTLGSDFAPNIEGKDKELTKTFQTVAFKPYNSAKAWTIDAKSGKTYTITLDYSDTSKPQIKYSEQGSVTPPTPLTNPIANRKYSEGYYLIGNFFNFDGADINYKDAVFKFKEVSADVDGNAIYSVEIPATLTAKAQVMSVGATGTLTAVYGPGKVQNIDNTYPKVGADHTATTGVSDLSPIINIGKDDNNYWNMSTRRTSQYEGGQDGSYTYKITIDKKTQLPTKWEIYYTDLKRVAYILSTEEDASANTLSATRNDIVTKDVDNFGSGKMVGAVYVKSGSKFYAISNAATQGYLGFNNDNPQYAYPGYDIKNTTFDILPTYPKLFLWGHGDANLTDAVADVNNGNNINMIAPNWGTFALDVEEGLSNWEFNFNKGPWEIGKEHGGMCGEIIKHGEGTVITSLSMVGPAIPGTMDGEK